MSKSNTVGAQAKTQNSSASNGAKVNLFELAMEATKNDFTRSSSKESVNDSLVRILFDGKKRIGRWELINQIAVERLIAERGEDELMQLALEDRPEYDKLVKAAKKTVKNGLDTSWSKSQNNSSFHFNPKYKHLELHKSANDEFWITERSKSESKSDSKK